MEDYQIARDVFVVLNFDDVSWLDMLPLGILKAACCLIELYGLLLVLAFVALVPLIVLKRIL